MSQGRESIRFELACGAGDGIKPRVKRSGTLGRNSVWRPSPSPVSRAWDLGAICSPGYHPGLYAVARFAGCSAALLRFQIYHQVSELTPLTYNSLLMKATLQNRRSAESKKRKHAAHDLGSSGGATSTLQIWHGRCTGRSTELRTFRWASRYRQVIPTGLQPVTPISRLLPSEARRL